MVSGGGGKRRPSPVNVDQKPAKQGKLIDDYDLVPSEEFKCYQQQIINMRLNVALNNTIAECKKLVQERVELIKANRQLQLEQLLETRKSELDSIFREFYQCIPLLNKIQNVYNEHQTTIKRLADRLELINGAILCQYTDWQSCIDTITSSHDSIDNDNTTLLAYANDNIGNITPILEDLNRLVSECERMSNSFANRRLLIADWSVDPK